MATPKVYFGVPDQIQEIPAPESGMGFVNGNDTEVTPLVSGGRAVYRAPLTYKTHALSWRTSATKLRHIIDCYNGQYGSGPFYITDPTASDLNVLPARWSLGWQLAHQANGWCKPRVDKVYPGADYQYQMKVNRRVVFTQATSGTVPVEGVVRTRVIKELGKPYYLTVDGSATGGAGIRVRGYNQSTQSWSLLTTVGSASFGASALLLGAFDNYPMLELDLYMPLGSTLTLRGVQLSAMNPAIPGNVLRTNYSTNPEAVSTFTGFATYLTGTSEAGTTTLVTAASDGPTVAVTTYGRRSTTTAKTSGSTGWSATAGTYRPGVTNGRTGDTITVSVWIRSSVPLTTSFRASAYTTGGSTVGTVDAPPVVLTAGQWVRLSSTVTATADYASVGWWAYQTSGATLPVGSTLDITGVLVEKSSGAGTYFSGATPSTGGGYYWTGAANSSTSVATDAVAQTTMPVGQGVGPIQFSGDADGRLTSKVIDRVGLSIDLVEVQNVGV